MASKKKPSKFKTVLLPLCIIGALGLFVVYKFLGSNVNPVVNNQYLYVPTGSTYADVIATLQKNNLLKDVKSFDFLAKQMHYDEKVKPGKYKLEKGMSNLDLVRKLRNGQQEPIKLVINKLRTPSDFYRLVAKNLETDTNAIKALVNDAVYMEQYDLPPGQLISLIRPNTYEFYWNTNENALLDKLGKTYHQFWSKEKQDLAQQLHLARHEVISLAAIVEEETNKNSEKSTIASVYLNRLKKGMKLQADPTARFAYGDFSIKRVTSKHTSMASPYNTYYSFGLPPTPICTPSDATINACLAPEKTNYLYFCAKADFSGYHAFAATYDAHMKNARLFQQALNERGIK